MELASQSVWATERVLPRVWAMELASERAWELGSEWESAWPQEWGLALVQR
jgi:hypothetical protein